MTFNDEIVLDLFYDFVLKSIASVAVAVVFASSIDCKHDARVIYGMSCQAYDADVEVHL